MTVVRPVLERERECLVNAVEVERGDPPVEGTALRPVLDCLVLGVPATHGAIDKAHVIWARALRDAVWLGWLSEAKRNKGQYSQEVCALIQQSLTEALEVGRAYAAIRS